MKRFAIRTIMSSSYTFFDSVNQAAAICSTPESFLDACHQLEDLKVQESVTSGSLYIVRIA